MALVVFLPVVEDNTNIKLMRRGRLWHYSRLLLFIAVVFAGAGSATVYAQTSSSNNYQVSETQFGSDTLKSCSEAYCAQASIGDMSAGRAKSSNGTGPTATFGPIIEADPLLEVIVGPGQSNLGVLNSETTASKTMTVQVRTYLSGGYTLQIVGDAPKYGTHELNTSSTAASSQPGTEQFGINLAKNTIPDVGAIPVQVPSDQTSFGEAETAYSVPNMFKYVNGDIVAKSLTESGRTDYTVSMIVNISNNTPAGHYIGEFSAVVTPIY